jgi:alpha-soluble NSF attachment protein
LPSFKSEFSFKKFHFIRIMSRRGDDFYRSAEKKLTSLSLFDRHGKFMDAAELFTKAGHSYKSLRDWPRAGHAYSRASDCYIHIDALIDAASSSSDAGKMYARDPTRSQDAIRAFQSAVQLYRESAKTAQAAYLLAEAAKVFQDGNDLDSAADALADAAQLYDDENQSLAAAAQITALANVRVMQRNWLEAAKGYRDVGMRRNAERASQATAGDYFTKAVVCLLAAGDSVGAGNELRDCSAANPGWARSRDAAMLADIIKAANENDLEEFASAVAEFDQVRRLDGWMTETLLVVRRLIEEEEDDLIL